MKDKKTEKNVQLILNLAVVVIGAYMIIKFKGAALPPVLSGIAFILIGLSQLVKLKR